MSKLKYLAIFFSFFTSYSLLSQQDPEAKKILEKFSQKVKSFPVYAADFTIIDENHQNGEKSENKGKVLIKGSKYKVEFNKTIIYFDGKNIYNYMPEAKEVSVVKPHKKDDDIFINNPVKFFNMYTSDYKFQYLGETTDDGINCYEVDLYPYDLTKKYSIIKLLISKEKLKLKSAKLIMKSGIHYIVQIDAFNGQAQAADKDFIFDIKEHKDVEVVDLR